MPNYRTTYATNALLIKPEAASVYTPIHGVQSVSVSTDFTQEQVYELGQLEIYENQETLPAIEIQVERVLDGEALLYHVCTQNASSSALIAKSKEKFSAALSIYDEADEQSSGTPLSTVICSGLYMGQINYNIPVNGNLTEQLTFLGNDKRWEYGSGRVSVTSGVFGSDSPVDIVKRRQHVIMGAVSSGSIWPTDIPGINGSGYNPIAANGDFGAHIQDVSISVNLGREDLFELGRRKPYYRYATTPIQVQTTINVTLAGDTPGDNVNADSERDNLVNQRIRVNLTDGTVFDLGTKNKLSNVTTTAAPAGQSTPATAQYTYTNFNIFTVTSPSL